MASTAAQPAQAAPAAAPAAPPAALPLPFADLAAELRLHASDRAEAFGPIAAIQALILSLLARLLGRLDAMFASRQHGQLLPATPARPLPHPMPPGAIAARTASPHARSLSVADWLFSFRAEQPPARAPRPSAPGAAPMPGPAPAQGATRRPAPRRPDTRPHPARAMAATSTGASPRFAIRRPGACAGRIPAPALPAPPRLQEPALAAALRHACFVTI